MKKLTKTGRLVLPTLVASPTSALYADSLIGASESLEGYALEMRKAEVEKQLTEIMTQQDALGRMRSVQSQVHHNVSYDLANDGSLSVRVGGEITPGPWELFIGGDQVSTLEIVEGQDVYQVSDSVAASFAVIANYKATLVSRG